MTDGDGAWAVVVLVDDKVEIVVGRMVGARPDLALVNALARLHLAAGRFGYSIRVRGRCEELCELLDLVGLADVVVVDSLRLPHEPRREAESGKQLGLEEVVEPGDPLA